MSGCGVTCPAGCQECHGVGTFDCYKCNGGAPFVIPHLTIANEGSCVVSCPSNQYGSPPNCRDCHATCQGCRDSGRNKCTSCQAGRTLKQALDDTTAGNCHIDCPSGQFYQRSSDSCKDCPEPCKSCALNSRSFCTGCHQTHSLVITNPGWGAGECRRNCPVGKYYKSSSDSCVDCPGNC